MEENELSVMEFIGIVLQGKKTIALITLIALLAGLALNIWLIKPQYEATTILKINEPIDTDLQETTPEALLDYLSRIRQNSVQSHIFQVTNPEIMKSVIAKMDLDVTPAELAGKIQAAGIKDTDLLKITVTDADPVRAEKAANTTAETLVDYMAEINRKNAYQTIDALGTSMKEEEEKLAAHTREMQEFLKQPDFVAELTKELESDLDKLATLHGKIVDWENEASGLQAAIETLQSQLQNIPEKLILHNKLAGDSGQQAPAGTGGLSLSLGNLEMQTEQINPVHTQLTGDLAASKTKLQQVLAHKAAAEKQVEQLDQNITRLQTVLAGKTVQYEQLQSALNLSQENYGALNRKYTESITAWAQKIDSGLIITSPAYAVPAGPKKSLNIAIAGMTGLILGILVVLFRKSWSDFQRSRGA